MLDRFMGFVFLQDLAAFLLFFWLLVTRREHQGPWMQEASAHLEQDAVSALCPVPAWDHKCFQVYPGGTSWRFQMEVTFLLV